MAGKDEATWRVGVLFSRSGVSGVTETEHFLGTALAIEEINTAGGVLGRPIEPICYDPAGDNDAYRSYARRMLAEDYAWLARRRGRGVAVATGVTQVASLAARCAALSLAGKPEKAAGVGQVMRRHLMALPTALRP